MAVLSVAPRPLPQTRPDTVEWPVLRELLSLRD